VLKHEDRGKSQVVAPYCEEQRFATGSQPPFRLHRGTHVFSLAHTLVPLWQHPVSPFREPTLSQLRFRSGPDRISRRIFGGSLRPVSLLSCFSLVADGGIPTRRRVYARQRRRSGGRAESNRTLLLPSRKAWRSCSSSGVGS
jgi:hypothetical protein